MEGKWWHFSCIRLQFSHLSFRGPRFELMASGTLELKDIGDSIGNYDLQLTSGADVTTCELPLFGVFCLRLACQPECLVEPVATGYLNLLVCSLQIHVFFFLPPPSLQFQYLNLLVCCLTWFIFSPSNPFYWIILPMNMSRLAVICIDFLTLSEIKYVPSYIKKVKKDNSYLSSLGFRMRRKSSLTGVC